MYSLIQGKHNVTNQSHTIEKHAKSLRPKGKAHTTTIAHPYKDKKGPYPTRRSKTTENKGNTHTTIQYHAKVKGKS